MRIVVVSSGQAALRLTEELSRENDVAVIHQGEEGHAELEKLDVTLIEGPGNDPKLLERAGVAEAEYLIACSRNDEMNILACLAAHRIGRPRSICFVEKEEYVRTFGAYGVDGPGGAPDLGIDLVIWPARMLADRIEKILAVPGATDVGRFADGQIALLEYRLREGIPLVDRPLMEIRGLPPSVLIVGVTRGEEWFVPRGRSVLRAGDRVSFVGRTAAMRQLAAWFTDYLGEHGGREVVIIGGGTVGLELARAMERNAEVRLKLIENDLERCASVAQALDRTLVLNGDGCDLDLLESERVFEADALVAVTDSDEKNLLASLLGRQLGIPKIVTRVSSASNRRVFERVGIDVPLSARGAATEAVLHMIRYKDVDLLATIGEGAGEVLEISLPGNFTPKPLKEIPLPPDSIIAALFRKNEAIVPGGATLLAPGDHCFVICKVDVVPEVLKALLG